MPMAGCHKSRGKYIVTGGEASEELLATIRFVARILGGMNAG